MSASGALLLSFVALVAGSPIVRTPSGVVEGLTGPYSEKFLGIKYGNPPVGSLRFKKPQPADPWTGTFQATKMGPACFQTCIQPAELCPQTMSEDCLSLSVWRPLVPAPQGGYPVYIWIHGGGFFQGAASNPVYIPDEFVNKTNTIVVDINYRVNVFGFLRLESAGIEGDAGFYDQLEAMKWTQKHIASFGGDPNRVTIGGQSAGGTSMGIHLVSPISWPYFHAVIMESNPLSLPLQTLKTCEILGGVFEKNSGCGSNLTCYLSMSASQIAFIAQETSNHISLTDPYSKFYPWTPIVDGDIIPDQPVKLMMAGKVKPGVKVLEGTVANETQLFIGMATHGKPLPDGIDWSLLSLLFNPIDASRIEEHYRGYFSHDNFNYVSFLGTHYIFECPNRGAARGMSKAGVEVYQYKFDVVSAEAPQLWGGRYHFCWDYVCHGSEIPFVFYDSARHVGINVTGREMAVSMSMAEQWGHFITHHAPTSSWPSWPNAAAAGGNTKLFTLAAPSGDVIANLDSKHCDFWDSIGYEHSGFL